jgi:NAD(P)-dependent dehydrogenase (short-subunit alcohol dehydrogenase family)
MHERLPEERAGVADVDLSDRTVFVTGSTSGIGRETALALGRLGATVIVHGRDREKGRATVDALAETGATASFHAADFADLDAVSDLAARVRTEHSVDVLVNNAGGYFPRSGTVGGLDYTFVVNHFAPFVLTLGLLDDLGDASRRHDTPGRVVTVSSEAHRGGRIDLDRLRAGDSFGGWSGYSASKLANVLFAFDLARRVDRVTSNCLHPGVVPGSGFFRAVPLPLRAASGLFGLVPGVDTVREAAATSVYLAAAPEVADATGAYFDDCAERRAARTASDRGLARRFFEFSAEATGVPADQVPALPTD